MFASFTTVSPVPSTASGSQLVLSTLPFEVNLSYCNSLPSWSTYLPAARCQPILHIVVTESNRNVITPLPNFQMILHCLYNNI